MRRVPVLATAVGVAVMALSQGSCRSLLCGAPTPARISIFPIDYYPWILWPGDVVPFRVAVAGDINEFCPESEHEIYASSNRPDAFVTAIDGDAGSVELIDRFTVKGVRPGTARLVAASSQLTTAVQIRVVPAIARIDYTVVPVAPRVGDTVTVTWAAIGPAGDTIPEPTVGATLWTPPYSSPRALLPGGRFVPTVIGTHTIQTAVQHAMVPPRWELTRIEVAAAKGARPDPTH